MAQAEVSTYHKRSRACGGLGSGRTRCGHTPPGLTRNMGLRAMSQALNAVVGYCVFRGSSAGLT